MQRTLGDFAVSMSQFTHELPEVQRRGVRASALYVTRSIRAEIRDAVGADMRMSGVGAKGARVGAKFDVRGEDNPTALIKATGPLHLVERDTSPHTIWPKGQTFSRTRRGNIRRRGKSKALAFGGGVYAYADHPGTRGKHPFQRGWEKAAPKAPRIFQTEVQAALRRALGVS